MSRLPASYNMLQSLRKHHLEELEQAFLDEVESYREIYSSYFSSCKLHFRVSTSLSCICIQHRNADLWFEKIMVKLCGWLLLVMMPLKPLHKHYKRRKYTKSWNRLAAMAAEHVVMTECSILQVADEWGQNSWWKPSMNQRIEKRVRALQF
ncbi:hypothetical protein ACSBR1_028034 [Camellia fascicularis]